MEKISVEQIDIVRERAHITYKEAKEVLERFNGDIVSSLLYLEEQDKVNSEFKKDGQKFYKKGKSILTKINNTRVIIKNKELKSLDISAKLAILLSILAPHILVIILPLSMLNGYKIRFEDIEELKVDLTKN